MKGRSFSLIILLITTGILVASCTKPRRADLPPGATTLTPGQKNQMVYAASADGNLYALDAQNGTVQWTFQLNNSGVWTDIISTPAYYDSVIYVASTDQNIYAVNAFSGKEVWHYKTNSTYGQFVSSPLVADGTVYIAGFEPKFYALDAKTGKLKWSRDFPRDFYSSPAYFNNTIFIACNDGGLYALDAGTGNTIWSEGGGSVNYSASAPCVKNGVVYAIAAVDTRDISGIVMNQLSAADGTSFLGMYSTFYFPSGAHFCPTIDDSILFVSGLDEILYAIKNGDEMYYNQMWQCNVGSTIAGSPVYDDSLVYVTTSGGRASGIYKQTGIPKWSFDTYSGNNSIVTSPVIANGVLFFGSTDRFWAVDAKTGKLMWETRPPMPFFSSPVVLAKDGKAYHAGVSGMQN